MCFRARCGPSPIRFAAWSDLRRALGAGARHLCAVPRSPGHGRTAGICGGPDRADAGRGCECVLADVRRRPSCRDRADALLERPARSASHAVSFARATASALAVSRPIPPRANSCATMREQLRDIMDTHGAVHCQIGRFYRMNASGIPGDLLSRLKRALDPHHRLNPGVLGLPQADDAPGKPS